MKTRRPTKTEQARASRLIAMCDKLHEHMAKHSQTWGYWCDEGITHRAWVAIENLRNELINTITDPD